jgi:hypothetical protein
MHVLLELPTPFLCSAMLELATPFCMQRITERLVPFSTGLQSKTGTADALLYAAQDWKCHHISVCTAIVELLITLH